MATINELVGQQITGTESGQRVFRVEGTSSAATAQALALAYADAVWNGLVRQTPNVEELGGDAWEAIVPYKPYQPGENYDTEWNFQIRTQSVRITQAEYHVATYGTPTAWDGAINVERSGGKAEPRGTDIVVPYFTWEETQYVPYWLITPSYLETLEATVGKTNDSPFRIWQTEELLLLGVTGSGNSRIQQPIPLTFSFAVSRTRYSFNVGGISVSEKKGHHYLWIEYEEQSYHEKLGPKPLAVHIERVYRTASYGNLNLYDPWT